MRSLLVTSVFLFFLAAGLRHPFIMVLAYIWVDIFTPQYVSYKILPSLPLAMITGSLAVLLIVARSRFNFTNENRLLISLFLLIALWGTLSLTWAVAPDAALEKWKWVSITLVFMAFLAASVRTKAEIEAVFLMMVFSAAIYTIPYSIKTILSGGSYRQNLGVVAGNSGLAEGSTLSIFVIALIPIGIYLVRHSDMIPFGRWGKFVVAGLSLASLLTAVGTHARAGLLAIGVLAVFYWLASSRKILTLVVFGLLVAASQPFLTDEWRERMNTLNTVTEETSAMGRVSVWLGTIAFVQNNPFGGSFGSYRAIEGAVSLGESGKTLETQGKAFHSIYFEVLGELGIPGLLLYTSMILVALWILISVKRRSKNTEPWIADLGRALLVSMVVMFLGGLVVGIAFQPFPLYFIALAGAYPSVAAGRKNSIEPDKGNGSLHGPTPEQPRVAGESHR